jgi:8-oxo-dGTP pyrophosphatase MutT (NUDIX family)
MVHASEPPDARAARERVRAALDPDPRPEAAPGDRLAAVLAPIVESPTPSLLVTERAASLRRHAGEVSFPGGLQDPGETLAATALRESFEEIGLDPGLPDLLGAMAPVHTFVSGILVVPFVGVLETLPRVTPSEAEIARVAVVPLDVLAEVEEQRELHREGDRVWRGWWYETAEVTIWGATGFMVHALLNHLRRERAWLS